MPIDVRVDPPLPKPTRPFGSTGPIDGSGLLPPCRYDAVRPSNGAAITDLGATRHRLDLDLAHVFGGRVT